MKAPRHATAKFLLLALIAIFCLPVPSAATTSGRATTHCPLCGAEITYEAVFSMFIAGTALDGRPNCHFSAPPLPVCPKDGLVVYKEKFDEKELESLKEIIQRPEYKETEASRAKLAVILEAQGASNYEIASQYLRASWQSNNRHYLEKTLSHLKKHIESGQPAGQRVDRFSLIALAGEMERRLNLFDEAKARFETLSNENGLSDTLKNQIIPQELELIGYKNSEPQWILDPCDPSRSGGEADAEFEAKGVYSTIEGLTQALKHKKVEVRQAAAEHLLDNPSGTDFLPLIATAKDDKCRQVRETVEPGRSERRPQNKHLTYDDTLNEKAKSRIKSDAKLAFSQAVSELKSSEYNIIKEAIKVIAYSESDNITPELIVAVAKTNVLAEKEIEMIANTLTKINTGWKTSPVIDSEFHSLLKYYPDDTDRNTAKLLGMIGSAASERIAAVLSADYKVDLPDSEIASQKLKAAMVLCRIGDPKTYGALKDFYIQKFNRTKYDLRSAVNYSFGYGNNSTERSVFINKLSAMPDFAHDWSILPMIGSSLCRMDNGEAAKFLIAQSLIESDDSLHALTSLKDCKNEIAVAHLIKTLESPNFLETMIAARALGDIGDERAVPALIKAANNRDYLFRIHINRAIGMALTKFNDPLIIDILLNNLEADGPNTGYVAEAILKYNDKEATKKLLAKYANGNRHVITDSKILDTIISFVDDSTDSQVSKNAREFLRPIRYKYETGPLFDHAAAWHRWWRKNENNWGKESD